MGDNAEVPEDPGMDIRRRLRPRRGRAAAAVVNEDHAYANAPPVDMANANEAAAAAPDEDVANDGFDTLFQGHVSWMEYVRDAGGLLSTKVRTENTLKIAAFGGNVAPSAPVAGVRAPEADPGLGQFFQGVPWPETLYMIMTSYSWNQLISRAVARMGVAVQIGDSATTRAFKEMLKANGTGVIFTNSCAVLRPHDIPMFLEGRQIEFPVILVLHNPGPDDRYLRGIILSGPGFQRACVPRLLMEFSTALRTPTTGCVIRGFQAPVPLRPDLIGAHYCHVHGFGLHYPVPQYPAAAALAPENRAEVRPAVNRPLQARRLLVQGPPPPNGLQPNNNAHEDPDIDDGPEVDNDDTDDSDDDDEDNNGLIQNVANRPVPAPANGQEQRHYDMNPRRPDPQEVRRVLVADIAQRIMAVPRVHHRTIYYPALFENDPQATDQQEKEMTPERGYLDALEEFEEQHNNNML